MCANAYVFLYKSATMTEARLHLSRLRSSGLKSVASKGNFRGNHILNRKLLWWQAEAEDDSLANVNVVFVDFLVKLGLRLEHPCKETNCECHPDNSFQASLQHICTRLRRGNKMTIRQKQQNRTANGDKNH